MRKTITTLFAALFIIACGDKTKQATDSTQASAQTDVTNDYALYDVKGNVLSITEDIYDSDAEGNFDKENVSWTTQATFNKKGKLLSDDAFQINKNWTVKRDAYKRIIGISGNDDGECPYERTNVFTYNDKGQLESMDNEFFGELHGTEHNVYKYDSDGKLTGFDREAFCDGISTEESITITPLETDAQGNWTRALFHAHSKEYDETSGKKELNIEEDTYKLHTRIIEYAE